MALDKRLLAKLCKKLKIGERRAYQMVSQRVSQQHVSPEIALLAIASGAGISITQHATSEQLSELRNSRSPDPVPLRMADNTSPVVTRRAVKRANPARRKPVREVWVVDGRDTRANADLRAFLRALGLKPLDFIQAASLTRKGAPYVGEILESAFKRVGAVVVLLTPDDEGRLHARHVRKQDPPHEKELTPQARLNVIFEAGMAFGHHADRTVIVQLGAVRPFSDIAGRHIVHLDNTVARRQELASKLRAAGADVDTSGTDWHTIGNFGNGAWPL